jgi:hypothetical protein
VESANPTLHATAASPVAPSPLAEPKRWKFARPKPELNRRERVATVAYLAMIALIVAFLAVVGLLAALGA